MRQRRVSARCCGRVLRDGGRRTAVAMGTEENRAMAMKMRAPHGPGPRSMAGAVMVLAVVAAASACGSHAPRGVGQKNPPAAVSHGPGTAAARRNWPVAVPDSGLAKGLVLPLE